MTWWDIRGKQLWHGIEGNFCSAGQRQSLKTIKAALSQLPKFSSCSRWTLFVSWFILPECIRNTAQLSRSHLMHPSEMFSITERSWEKNCWLLQGLTFKKEKKKKKEAVFWTDAFTTFLQFQKTTVHHFSTKNCKTHSSIQRLYDREEIKNEAKTEKTLYIVLRLQSCLLEPLTCLG